MSTISKLLGLAQKALDQRSGSRPAGSAASGTDWRQMVRTAADAVTGDSRGGAASGTSHRASSPRPGAATEAGGWTRWDDDGAARPAGGAPTGTSGTGSPAREGAPTGAALSAEDRRAIARYDYLVRTADPDQLEQVHREAFDRLTPLQRTQIQARMREELPSAEQPRSDSSADLARSATRLGALDPRRLTSLLSRAGGSRRGGSAARGAMIGAAGGAAGLLAVVAGGAVLTSIGGSLLTAAVGDGIDVDALVPDLQMDLGELGALGDVNLGDMDLSGLADVSANDVMEGAQGLGETSLSDLGNLDLGDIGGFFGR